MNSMTWVVGSNETACDARMPPACAIASICSTPGITGTPGKWPWKNGSLNVTFLSATHALVGQLEHAIDEQERIAMRQQTRGSARPSSRAGVASMRRSIERAAPIRAPDAPSALGDSLHLGVELRGQIDGLVGPHHGFAVDDDVDAFGLRDRLDLRARLLSRSWISFVRSPASSRSSLT